MRLLPTLCVLCSLAAPGLAVDRDAFTFTNYDLNLRIEPEQQRLAVRGKIVLRNDSRIPQKNLALQISSTLGWRSIKVGGNSIDFTSHEYASDIDHTGALSEAVLTLPQAVPPQATVELEVGYEGTVGVDATRLTRIGVPKEKAEHSDWDRISKSFTAIRGIGYVAWYPVAVESANLSEGNSVFEAVARWKERTQESGMTIHVEYWQGDSEVSSSVVCNDWASGVTTKGDNVADCRFSPLARTVPVVAAAPYATQTQASTTVYYLAEHKAAAESYLLAAELAGAVVTDWFGPVRRQPRVAELPDPDDAAFDSGGMLLAPLRSGDSRAYALDAVYQLANAAFNSPRPWIEEGLAHFAQAVARQQEGGRQAALDFLGMQRAAIAAAEQSGEEEQKDEEARESLINTGREEFYRSKAMYAWWMLYDMIGENALKKAVAAYQPEQDKQPAYVQHLVEAQSKRDLEWFFDDWVYRDRKLPDFRIESAYPRATVNGGYVVTITVENLGSAGAEVPVIVRMEGGDTVKRVEVRAHAKSVTRIEAASTPKEVVVNDGSVPESDMTNNSLKIEIPSK